MERETSAADIGCFIFVIVLSIGAFLGYDFIDNHRHDLSFHGQIIAITPTSRGYVASIMCDNAHEGVYFTVEQANTYKVGDIVDYTAVYDGWGYFKELRVIRKAK